MENLLGWLVTANALVKGIAFLLVWALLWLPVAWVVAWRLSWQPPQPLSQRQKLSLLASLYLLAPLVVGIALPLAGISWADCGLLLQPAFWLSLVAGLGLSIGSLAVIFLTEGWCQWLEWHPENYPRLLSVTPTLFASALAIGLIEELIFRGFLQTLFEQDYSPWGAALLASTIFALLHLVWGEAETMPQLPGLWLMGIVLTVARWVAGGGLGLAWGLHAGWLWGLWCLDGAKAFSYTGKGASWLTGLNGQPLAGLAGVACMLGTGMVCYLSFVVCH